MSIEGEAMENLTDILRGLDDLLLLKEKGIISTTILDLEQFSQLPASSSLLSSLPRKRDWTSLALTLRSSSWKM